MKDDEEKSFLDRSFGSSNQIAFASSMTDIIYSNMKHKNSFVHKVCKQNIYTVNIVIYFPKNFYLVEEINRKISSLLSAGIVSHLIEKYVDMRFWEGKTESKGRQKLSLKHLEGAFVLWIIFCSISFTFFLLELCTNVVQGMKSQNARC